MIYRPLPSSLSATASVVLQFALAQGSDRSCWAATGLHDLQNTESLQCFRQGRTLRQVRNLDSSYRGRPSSLPHLRSRSRLEAEKSVGWKGEQAKPLSCKCKNWSLDTQHWWKSRAGAGTPLGFQHLESSTGLLEHTEELE